MSLQVHLVFVLLLSVQGEEVSNEFTIEALRKQLLKNYDPNAHPVPDFGTPTVVEAGLTPTYILDMNENTGILTLEGWMHMTWVDHNLKWNPKDYYYIKVVQFSEREIWKPDLSVFNGRGSRYNPFYRTKLSVSSTGAVTWNQPASMQLVCSGEDYSNYPADVQNCVLKLGSWTFDETMIDLKAKQQEELPLDLYQSSANPHWEVTKITGQESVQSYSCCEDPYVHVEYQVTMKRRNVPFRALCSVTDNVARVLILCMFWVPNGMRKLILGCTSLLILTVIGACVTSNLPSPAAAPAALFKINSAMSLCVGAIMLAILVSGISNCGWASPRCLETLVSSAFCWFLNPCEKNPGTTVDVEYTEGIVDNAAIPPKTKIWPFLAIAVDRVAFVVFAVLFVIV